jgi:putative MATE family efflux protein
MIPCASSLSVHDRGLRPPGTRNPYDREIVRLAIPAFGALVAEPLYVLADTAIVGHLGTDQLAGLAVASSVLLTLYAVFIFLAYGTTAAVSRLLGAGDEREAAHQAVQSLWLALLIGIRVALIGVVLAEPIDGALGADGAVRTNAIVYLRISLVGVPALLLVLAGTGYLRGLQDTRTPLLVAGSTAVVNLVIQVVLIYGFDQGIGASALSTVIAQTAAAAVYVWRVTVPARRLGAGLGPHPASLRQLAVVGRDLLVRTAALRVALVAATAVAARIGTDDLAAYEVSFQIWGLLAYTLDAVAFVLDGVLIGAGDMRFLAWSMAGAAAVFVPAAGVVLVLGLGLGWLWAALGLLMAARSGALLWRFTGDRWIVLGASR